MRSSDAPDVTAAPSAQSSESPDRPGNARGAVSQHGPRPQPWGLASPRGMLPSWPRRGHWRADAGLPAPASELGSMPETSASTPLRLYQLSETPNDTHIAASASAFEGRTCVPAVPSSGHGTQGLVWTAYSSYLLGLDPTSFRGLFTPRAVPGRTGAENDTWVVLWQLSPHQPRSK